MSRHSSAGLRIKENKEVYEGEVIELTPEETENQMGGYGKVISHVLIGLKSVKGTKQLKLDPTIFDSLQKEKVQVKPSAEKSISADLLICTLDSISTI